MDFPRSGLAGPSKDISAQVLRADRAACAETRELTGWQSSPQEAVSMRLAAAQAGQAASKLHRHTIKYLGGLAQ